MSEWYELHEAAVRSALAGRNIWSIMIYCHEPSHSDKPWDIDTFRLILSSQSAPLPFWEAHSVRTVRRDGRAAIAARRNEQYLSGNRQRQIQQLPSEAPVVPDDVDIRYPLRCKKCDLSIPRRRRRIRQEDDLQIALDKVLVADAGRGIPPGESRVSLTELGAILGLL
jgi:hypothetical protein